MGTPPFFAGGVEPPTKFSKRGGLTGPQLLEGVAGKEGVTLIRRGLQFSHKNKLKSEIFNDKKSLLAKTFFCVTTKNLVTFKR